MSSSVGLWMRDDGGGRLAAAPYLREPWKPPADVFHRLLARQRIVADGEFGRLQALDLVAQPRGFLEFEIGRGLAHALLHIRQHRLRDCGR